MMTRSAFQGGSNSPPYSPARIPTRVYTSVAEMKRSKGKVQSHHHIYNCLTRNKHYYNLVITDNPLHRACLETEETVAHVFFLKLGGANGH